MGVSCGSYIAIADPVYPTKCWRSHTNTCLQGGNADKGQRYIAALDQARAQGKWEEVPELIRKVTKHAPQKTCMCRLESFSDPTSVACALKHLPEHRRHPNRNGRISSSGVSPTEDGS